MFISNEMGYFSFNIHINRCFMICISPHSSIVSNWERERERERERENHNELAWTKSRLHTTTPPIYVNKFLSVKIENITIELHVLIISFMLAKFQKD